MQFMEKYQDKEDTIEEGLGKYKSKLQGELPAAEKLGATGNSPLANILL